jgi:gliding motility-associated-like protein
LLNNPSETLDSIAIGDYYFKITDANQCVVDTIVTMTQPTDFTLTNVTTANLCFADSTGAVDLTVSGATQPYTYNWSNGQSTQDLNNVVAGIYTAIVMDSNGCVDSMVTEVTQPTAIQTSFNSINVSCVDQSDGSIALTVIGGSQPYAYQWSNGNTNEDLTDLTSGAYSITITDNQMCTMSLTVVIAESEMPCITPPNTITPNGDLYNDTWVLDNMHLYPEALIQVYNRWGNLLFSSKGTYTPWDGSYRGNPLPSEVYYYIIDLYDISQTKLTGTLTIIR